MSETFGQRMQRLRRAKGLTQEDVAKRMSVTPQAVSKWEKDASSPDITMLSDLADILDVTIDELLGRTNYTEDSYVEAEEVKLDNDNKNKKEKVKVTFKDGIHIIGGKEEVHIDKDGITVNERKIIEQKRKKKVVWITTGTLIGLAIIAYVLVGLLWTENNIGWLFGWTFILDALWISSISTAIKHKKISDFSYPLLITSVYCKLGFLGANYGFEGWGFYWFLFITIPAFYLLANPIDKSVNLNSGDD